MEPVAAIVLKEQFRSIYQDNRFIKIMQGGMIEHKPGEGYFLVQNQKLKQKTKK